jgi:hypothetical protein
MNQAPIVQSTKPLSKFDPGLPFWNPGSLGVYAPQHNSRKSAYPPTNMPEVKSETEPGASSLKSKNEICRAQRHFLSRQGRSASHGHRVPQDRGFTGCCAWRFQNPHTLIAADG